MAAARSGYGIWTIFVPAIAAQSCGHGTREFSLSLEPCHNAPVELTPLRYFRAIAATGHLTRAAQTLGVTQPALSAMMKKLEAEVGAPLLHRTGRGVELTEAGRVFLIHCEEAVRSADSATRAVRELLGLERGTIRIGGGATAITYLLPPVVGAVRRAHAGLKFYVREAGSTTVAEAVLSGALDLGIVTLPIVLPGADDLLRIPLVEDEMRLIVPPGHRMATPHVLSDTTPARRSRSGFAGSFRWNDLRGEPVVAFEAGSAVRDVIDRAAGAAGVPLDVVMELRSIESIKRMVEAGIGVGLVSRFALDEGEGLRCADGSLTRRLAIVRRRDREQSPAAAEFERQLLRSMARGT